MGRNFMLDRSDLDAANTFTWLDSNFDVAFITPSFTPGVFSQKVIHSIFGTVANDEDSMVDFFATTLISDYTTRILNEYDVVCLNGDSYGSILKCTHKLVRTHWRNVHKVGNANSILTPISFASLTGKSFIWIVDLHHDSVILSISESTVHNATHATFVSIDCSTVNQLLFTNIMKLTGLKKMCSFYDASCSKSPI